MGNVKADLLYIGAGSIIRQGINIGSNSFIGMGSVVAKDVQIIP